MTTQSTPVIEAILFDLDGVLVDTEIWWDEVRRDYAARHGRAWTAADRESVMGANSRQWSRTMAERLALEVPPIEIERAVVSAMIDRWRSAPAPLIDGADEVVRRLAATYPLGVASSAHRAVIETALERTGLGAWFQAVVSSDEVARGKPAGDVYLAAAAALSVAPNRCLVVEDSLNGVLAGRAAGMTVVLVPNRSVPPADGAREAANVVIENLRDLDPGRIIAA